MKKRIILVILCAGILIVGSMTAYKYLEKHEEADYSSGMFVDGGDNDGHATMYDLYQAI